MVNAHSAITQYERALEVADARLQECVTRQADYMQRLSDAKFDQSATDVTNNANTNLNKARISVMNAQARLIRRRNPQQVQDKMKPRRRFIDEVWPGVKP